MHRTLPLLCLALVACDRSAPSRPNAPEAPPNGRGRYTDDAGQDHTVFRPLGVIRYGEERTGQVPDAHVLLGYEFEARSGARPVIQLAVQKGVRVGLALYGPRGTEGLWDEALSHVSGEGTLSLADVVLDVPGMYFILVRSLAEDAVDYTVRLRCEGDACGEPDCPDVEACDLVCDGGYSLDDGGCRQCACEATACRPGECPEGERCVEGQCRAIPCAERCEPGQDPICGSDGQTWRSACTAACAGVEVAHPGPCEGPPACDEAHPCPGDGRCNNGRCEVDDCGCAIVRAPVCSAEGQTFPNRCLLECRGQALAYPGPCVDDYCRGDADCGEGESCQPLPDRENLRRCRMPDAPECIRQCRPAESATCGRDGPVCRPEQICVTVFGPDRPGTCTEPCRPGEACTDPGERCAVLFGQSPDRGFCLPGCGGDAPPCAPGQACLPDQRGQQVCSPSPCGCPDPAPEDVVCARGREIASACFARCFGAFDFQPGACVEAPAGCACPPDRRPLACTADGTLYADACDAACAEAPLARPATCLGETPLTCTVDEDCLVTGCDGTVCAAAATDHCPAYSDAARCRVATGQCGCQRVEGQPTGTCTFGLTREAQACVEAAHAP
ncbi:MAG: Kazal-type serine protease inhibitor [bacterium]